MNPLEIIKEERAFLHDVSNHLLVAQGMGAFISKVINENFQGDSKEVERAKKALDAVEKIIELVKERRDLLYQASSD